MGISASHCYNAKDQSQRTIAFDAIYSSNHRLRLELSGLTAQIF
jgi:hypothetical protein